MVAYVDSSVIVAVAFEEPEGNRVQRLLRRHERLLSSNLLEAEVRAALAREGADDGIETLLAGIDWILPTRPLRSELARALAAGRVRGANLWHLACALYIAPSPAELGFLTLDRQQAVIARALGFRVRPAAAIGSGRI